MTVVYKNTDKLAALKLATIQNMLNTNTLQQFQKHTIEHICTYIYILKYSVLNVYQNEKIVLTFIIIYIND